MAIAAAGIGADARHHGVISSDRRVVEAAIAVIFCRSRDGIPGSTRWYLGPKAGERAAVTAVAITVTVASSVAVIVTVVACGEGCCMRST